MRSTTTRQRTVRLAIMAASLALLAAACGADENPRPDGPDGEGILGEVGGVELAAGTLLISDGTDRVRIGDATIIFPGPVTDAVWSPDGSRIAYVDGDGNIATARPDGSDVLVLTRTDPSVVRSRPTWSREWILYAETKSDGTSALRSVPTNGCSMLHAPATGDEWPMDTGEGTSYVDLSPSSSLSEDPLRIAFQHDEPAGPEIWVNDSNQRVPVTYKVTDGSEPALTPDGRRLAYVGPDGDIYVTMPDHEGVAGTRVTVGAQHPTRLAWSPDGQHIAYATATSVVATSAEGGASAPTTLAPAPGVPAYLSGAVNTLNVVTGTDPVALSVAASAARWPGVAAYMVAQSYEGAYTATIGLAERPPAPEPGGPLLLLGSPDELDPRITGELHRIFGAIEFEPPTVYVAPEVSTAVDEQLTALGFQVSRRLMTIDPPPEGLCPPANGRSLFDQRLVVVNGDDAAGRWVGEALATWGPVLVLDGQLTEEQTSWLRHSSGVVESVYVVGSVPEETQQRIAALVSGPFGFTTIHNPTVPPLS